MLTLSWTRLEPGIRTPDLQAGIEARTHDPLWMLARQWQFGEFRAEDAGTPIALGDTPEGAAYRAIAERISEALRAGVLLKHMYMKMSLSVSTPPVRAMSQRPVESSSAARCSAP